MKEQRRSSTTPIRAMLLIAAALLVALFGSRLIGHGCSGRQGGGPQDDLAAEPQGARQAPAARPDESATGAAMAQPGHAEEAAKQGPPAAAQAPDDQPGQPWRPPRFTARQEDRDRMVQVIRAYGLDDQAVIDAMTAVPRHEFVPARLAGHAYNDSPLPIGYGQTISQPYIVAEMTRQLHLEDDSRVLEIGTGSGYQAAVLTEFTPHVYTIEIVEPLAVSADGRLGRLGYNVVQVHHGDGYYGWPEAAPFDAIIVTAAAGQIPPPLLKQLATGGRMVIPIGGRFSTQSLMLVEKMADGSVRSRNLMSVVFVPFVH